MAFLADLLIKLSGDQESHFICDNLSAPNTQRVDEFLRDDPNVHLHVTPTYSSWLQQVELWFAKIERELIYRGIFTSVTDLARRIMVYIKHCNADPRPIKWQYADPTRRFHAAQLSNVTVH